MSDPAIEAAQRTLQKWTTDGWNASRDFVAVEAAREALAPLRELHHVIEVWQYDDVNGVWAYDDDDERILLERWCSECSSDDAIEAIGNCEWQDGSAARTLWPCATARLIYSSEEL